MIYLDFETRSKADLKAIGAWEYSVHPSTEILCLGWSFDGIHVYQWRIGETEVGLYGLFDKIEKGADLEAHNAFFEICVWLNICGPKMGWPVPKLEQWHCSAAKAAACGLPRGLADAGKAIGALEVKDESRKKAMLLLSVPNKKTNEFLEDGTLFKEMLAYNQQDVVAEANLSSMLPGLSEKERRVWLMDLRMNLRGFKVDYKGAEAAIKVAEYALEAINESLRSLTSDLVKSATQREAVRTWINTRMEGEWLPDTQARTLDYKLTLQGIPEDVREALRLVREAGRSSVAKYKAMRDYAKSDERARGQHLYCGAGKTGRWSGSGIQPHNFTRKGHKDQNLAWTIIKRAAAMDKYDALDFMDLSFGCPPNEALSMALRGAITAGAGGSLFVQDFSAEEARVVFWLAREEAGLKIFRDGGDMYLEMASIIYNRLITEKGGIERFLGKQSILGLGFEMGFIKFLVTCRMLGAPPFSKEQVIEAVGGRDAANVIHHAILERDQWLIKNKRPQATVMANLPGATGQDYIELVLMKHCVDMYRSRFSRVTESWRELEVAVRVAVSQPKTQTHAARCDWIFEDGKFLECRLPSGRIMRFCDPRVDNDGKLSYMTTNPTTKQWVRAYTYGGHLMQGATQATARDALAEAMLNVDEHPNYDLVLSVHDEVGAESEDGDLEEYEKLVVKQPSWAPDLPIKAEGWTGFRYRKG